MLNRDIAHRLRSAKKSILLLGARQVGKSTLLRTLEPDLFINLADEEQFLRYSKDPGRLKREVMALSKDALIIIDEVQRTPSLLNSVQALLDEQPQRRFVLTGSSARKLKRGGANLLPGRIILEYLDPLSFWELGDQLDLERALQMGLLPGIYLDTTHGADVLSTYATVYLREEIQAEAVVKNIGDYARFLDLAAEASGQWINYSKLASDSEIPKETIRRFFTILEDTLLVHRIPPFRPSQSKRRVSQRDRFVFFDVGVRNALLGIHRNAFTPTELGNLFEQWIILQCLTFIRTHHKEWRYSAYRTESGAEVDFVLELNKKFIAIECKFGRNVTESQLTGLRSFAEVTQKPVERLVVYRGERKERFADGTIAMPYQEFLRDFLPAL